ncbi:unnamed protein product [Diamesa hyperborea]
MVMAEMRGGPMAHQLPLHNHRGGLVQPSLVINQNNMDYGYSQNKIKTEKLKYCVGCGNEIQDKFILRVAPDLEWHAACLKCQECNQYLGESCTCFVRDGRTYCKKDYDRLFGAKCNKCGSSFSKSDFVMRAKSKIFHIKCFCCSACDIQLKPGDEFALRDGGVLYCKTDHDLIENMKTEPPCAYQLPELNNNINIKSTLSAITKTAPSDFGSISDSDSETDSFKSSPRKKSSHLLNGKPARVRTVLTEKQLNLLRACYNANSRPDALVKEQLVELTGLSARVIRVWFQNKRCKDKKKSVEIKLQMRQEKEGIIGNMQGIPLIASPPVKHEFPLNYQGYEVTKYQPPWKTFSEYAMNSDSDERSSFENHTPAFQHLVNQLHGYDIGEESLLHANYPEKSMWHKVQRDSTDSYQESEESIQGSL